MPNGVYVNTDRLLWSTEGGGKFNSASPNIGGLGTTATNGFAPPASVLNATGSSELMDVSGYDELLIKVILTGFTGGASPSFLPEWDILDDHVAAGVWTPDAIALWKPGAAVTTATKWLTAISAKGLGTAPTISGYAVASIPFPFGNLGRLAWTIANTPTTVTWSAFIYGKGRA